MASMASRRVLPEDLPEAVSLFQPLYQVQLGEGSIMLSPSKPEIGTKGTALGLYPTFLMKLETSLMISLKRDSDHLVVSILLMATMSCLTPRVKASRACSRVWPSLEIPASNSPVPAAMMRIAQSAWEVPVIMFLMKSRWPGASMTVTLYFGVSNFQRAISMVIPRSRSDFSLSRTHAYLKDFLPNSSASFSNFSMVRLSIPPHL
ncbi:ankyrin repeat protein [Histoplasma ohiense]